MLRYFLAALAAFAILFPANGLFHTVLAAGFFDVALRGLGQAVLPMAEGHPGPVALLDGLLALGVLLFTAMAGAAPKRGALSGAALNFLTASAWNLANMATLAQWPARVYLLDAAWHTGLGAVAGAVAGLILRGRLKESRAGR